MEYIFIGIGGSLGAIGRYMVGSFVHKRWFHKFPLGTFTVNIFGSFALGMVFVFINNLGQTNMHLLENFLALGFLGALTTYSTFAYEVLLLLEKNKMIAALWYIFLSLTLGIGGFVIGFYVLSAFLAV